MSKIHNELKVFEKGNTKNETQIHKGNYKAIAYNKYKITVG